MTHRITLLLEYTKPEEVEKRKEEEAKAAAEEAREEEAIRAFRRRTESWRPEDVDRADFWEDDDPSEEETGKHSSAAVTAELPAKVIAESGDETVRTDEKHGVTNPVQKKETAALKVPEFPASERTPEKAASAEGKTERAPSIEVKSEEAVPVRYRRPRKPFVWTPGELEDEEYWLDADLPEDPLDEDDPGRRYILPDDDEDDET